MPRTIRISEPRLRSLVGVTAPLLLLFVLSVANTPAWCADNPAQNNAGQSNYGGRKLLSRVDAEYPPGLRAAGIGGYVHLSVTISPNGTVASSEVVGGNPILAEAAAKAVAKWKFSAGTSSTSAEIWFHFAP